MPRAVARSLPIAIALVLTLSSGRSLAAQAPAGGTAQPPTPEQLALFVKAHLAVSALRDQMHQEFAEPKNKKVEVQVELRDKLRTGIANILKANKLTQAEFDRITFLISADAELRKTFDAAVAQVGKKEPPST